MNILLHICCGPCAIAPVHMLRDMGHTVTGFFYNPNIHPLSEYLRRREAAHEAAEKMDLPMIWADLTDPDAWNLPQWLTRMHGIEANGPDSPAPRCVLCYDQRMKATARAVAQLTRDNPELKIDAFTTSLLYSRHQLHERIVESGHRAALRHEVEFFYHDFRSGWQFGIDQSKEWGLYRQNYCACVLSEAERFAGKFEKLKARERDNA